MGTAVAVLSSTVLGLAVSTSHCLVGAIIGIGLADRFCRLSLDAELNLSMIVKIVLGWAATIPLAMAVSVLTYWALARAYTEGAWARACERARGARACSCAWSGADAVSGSPHALPEGTAELVALAADAGAPPCAALRALLDELAGVRGGAAAQLLRLAAAAADEGEGDGNEEVLARELLLTPTLVERFGATAAGELVARVRSRSLARALPLSGTLARARTLALRRRARAHARMRAPARPGPCAHTRPHALSLSRAIAALRRRAALRAHRRRVCAGVRPPAAAGGARARAGAVCCPARRARALLHRGGAARAWMRAHAGRAPRRAAARRRARRALDRLQGARVRAWRVCSCARARAWTPRASSFDP